MISLDDMVTMREMAKVGISAGFPYVDLSPTRLVMTTSTGIEVVCSLEEDGQRILMIGGREYPEVPWPADSSPATLAATLAVGRSILGL